MVGFNQSLFHRCHPSLSMISNCHVTFYMSTCTWTFKFIVACEIETTQIIKVGVIQNAAF